MDSIANELADAPGRQNRRAARATTRPAWLLAGCFLVQPGAAANSVAIRADLSISPGLPWICFDCRC